MEKQYLFLKSVSCRPTFHLDMSSEERQVMMQHIAYWTEITKSGNGIIFGAVAEATGNWGLGIIEIESENEVLNLIDNDPAFIGKLMTYEYHPIRIGMIRGMTK